MSTLKSNKRYNSESHSNLPNRYKNSGKSIQSLIQATQKNEDIIDKAYGDIAKKLVQNQANEIKFYDIPTYQEKKKKQQLNFKSIYVLSELQLLRGTGFYDRVRNEFENLEGKKQFSLTDKLEKEINLKKDKTELELKMRKQLSLKGNILMLNEIYDKFDENIEQMTVVSSVKESYLRRQAKEKESELLNGLDLFHKNIKQEKEKQKMQMKQQQLQEEQEKQNRDRASSYRTLDRRQSLLNIVKTNMQINNANSNNSKNTSDQEIKTPTMNNNNSISMNSSNPFPQQAKNSQKRLSTFLSKASQAKIANVVQTQEDKTSEKERSEFITNFNNAYQSVKPKHQEGVGENQDRATRKRLEKYIQGGVQVDNATDQVTIEENNKFDSTPEGIKLNLDVIYSNKQIEIYNSVVQKANYFEKQSQIFETRLNTVISNTQAYINSKENTLRIIRQENHVISNKRREIRNYMESLLEEKRKLENPVNTSHNHANDSPTLENQSKLLESRNSQIHNKSQLVTKKENRQAMINDIMKKEEKLKEIDDQLEIFKENFKKFGDKTDYNGKIILEIEVAINQKRKQLKVQMKTLKALYNELLTRGKDVREEGLSWIIRKLWSLEETVLKIDLPFFLDEKARDYLMLRAQKEQDLLESQTLLDLYLDMYKTNLLLHSQKRQQEMEDYEIEENNNQMEFDNSVSIIENKNNTANNTLIHPNTSQINNSQSMPSMNKSQLNISIGNNNLSFVNIQQAKDIQLVNRRNKKVTNVDVLLDGMSPDNQDISNTTINQLSATKLTTANIIYDETQKKIQKNVRNWMDLERQESRSLHQDLSITLDDAPYQPLVHKIELFDNGKHINEHSNREEFIEDYRKLQKLIKSKIKKIKYMDEEEVQRIVKEFDFKQYDKKYQTNCSTVLGAIFGSTLADKLIIRYGMSKK